ncbi:MAG: hypothetical protein HQL71_01035 [Magnetococcales bacterium]|nr:hypothetical protein [Magnetococcales bacterium]
MVNWAKDRNIPFLVGSTSTSIYSDPLKKVLSQHNIQFFEADDVFKLNGLTRDEVTNPQPDGHWNKLGNQLVAKEIESYFTKNKWLEKQDIAE